VYVKVWPFHTFTLYELSYYVNLKRYTIKLMEFNIQIHHSEIKKVSHPVLKAKPNALITCAPGSSYTHA
jgi:hypothetical protein